MKWINIKDRFPICYKSGNWDGLQSDVVLTKDKEGVIRACICISGRLDGSEFADFYSTDDWEIENVIHWASIDELLHS